MPKGEQLAGEYDKTLEIDWLNQVTRSAQEVGLLNVFRGVGYGEDNDWNLLES